MKDILILGVVAIGGYILYEKFMSQESSLVASVNANTGAATYSGTGQSTASKYYITPQMMQDLQSFYVQRWNTTNNPTLGGWTYVFNQLYGYSVPNAVLQSADASNSTYSVSEFADLVNSIVTTNNLSGLGMLAIGGNYGVSLTNNRLPANLELFNAMLH